MTLRWAGGPAPLGSRSLIGSFEHRCPQTQSSGEHENPTTEVAARDSCRIKRWEKSTQTAQAYSFTSRHYPLLLVSLTFQLSRKRATSGEFFQKFFARAKVFSPQIHEATSWNCEQKCLKYMYYLAAINRGGDSLHARRYKPEKKLKKKNQPRNIRKKTPKRQVYYMFLCFSR